MKPESVLNLGSNLKSNVTPLGGGRDDPERFVAVSTMCENDSFIFLQLDCVADETTHLICYEKATRTTRHVDSYNFRLEKALDHGFIDDLGSGIPFFPHFIARDGRAYMLLQAVNIVAKLGEDRARDMGIAETDNPVIVIAKLKK
jgi:hypothetical protein